MAGKLARRQAKHDDFIGDGPVRYRFDDVQIDEEGATAAISVSIDYGAVPVPNNYYVADFFYVESFDSSVLLVFGKRDGPRPNAKLRTKLEVYFPSDMFVRQLWKGSRKFHEAVYKEVKNLGYSIPGPGDSAIPTPEKVQTIQANNVVMARSGLETVLDFYTLSPKEIAFKTRKKRPVELEPLARIIFVGLPLLVGFLDACNGVAESLSAQFPVDQEQEEIA